MRRFPLLTGACFLSFATFAQTPAPPADKTVAQGVDLNYENKQTENDMDALRRWLQDKRLVSLKELGGDLSISGEVRTEGQYFNEKEKTNQSENAPYIQQRGIGSATGKPSLAWDVEFNLLLDYHTERTWAAVKVEFDNDMGTRSGTANRIRLEKAYLGGRLIAGDTITWDAEIGRRYLSNVYDSKIQFGSIFDGGLFRFAKAFEAIGDFYANLAVFLVNDKFNHYGEVLEIGALKIANTPLNMRYSVINWYRHYTQPELGNGTAPIATFPNGQGVAVHWTQPWRYLVNQYTIFYQIYPDWFNKKLLKFYAAGLMNVLARPTLQTGYITIYNPDGTITKEKGRKANLGWYAGVSMGVVKKAGDWAVDANYQWAQAQVAPPVDSSGIGTGNAAGQGFFQTKDDGSGAPTTFMNAISPYNYQGYQIEALYAFTNNLTLQQTFIQSWTLNRNIGQPKKYKQYEIEFIYAF